LVWKKKSIWLGDRSKSFGGNKEINASETKINICLIKGSLHIKTLSNKDCGKIASDMDPQSIANCKIKFVANIKDGFSDKYWSISIGSSQGGKKVLRKKFMKQRNIMFPLISVKTLA
jgi:hypothetical protein